MRASTCCALALSMNWLLLHLNQLLFHQALLTQAQSHVGTVEALIVRITNARAGIEVPTLHFAHQHVQSLLEDPPLSFADARAQVLDLRMLLADEIHQVYILLLSCPRVAHQLRVELQYAWIAFRVGLGGGLPLD